VAPCKSGSPVGDTVGAYVEASSDTFTDSTSTERRCLPLDTSDWKLFAIWSAEMELPAVCEMIISTDTLAALTEAIERLLALTL
jgi:hypothetical protein